MNCDTSPAVIQTDPALGRKKLQALEVRVTGRFKWWSGACRLKAALWVKSWAQNRTALNQEASHGFRRNKIIRLTFCSTKLVICTSSSSSCMILFISITYQQLIDALKMCFSLPHICNRAVSQAESIKASRNYLTEVSWSATPSLLKTITDAPFRLNCQCWCLIDRCALV